MIDRIGKDFEIFFDDVWRLASIVRAQIIRKGDSFILRVGEQTERQASEDLEGLIRFELLFVGLVFFGLLSLKLFLSECFGPGRFLGIGKIRLLFADNC